MYHSVLWTCARIMASPLLDQARVSQISGTVMLQMSGEPPTTEETRSILGERRYQGSTAKVPPAADARALQAVTAILSPPAGRSKRKRKSSSHQAGLRQARVSCFPGSRCACYDPVISRCSRVGPAIKLTLRPPDMLQSSMQTKRHSMSGASSLAAPPDKENSGCGKLTAAAQVSRRSSAADALALRHAN